MSRPDGQDPRQDFGDEAAADGGLAINLDRETGGVVWTKFDTASSVEAQQGMTEVSGRIKTLQ